VKKTQFALIDEGEELHVLVEDIHGDYNVLVIQNKAGEPVFRRDRHISSNEAMNVAEEIGSILEGYNLSLQKAELSTLA
jgi:hypothetical protein